MPNEYEVKNAVIESASLRIERGFLLDASICFDYGGSGQCFGGHALYLGKSAAHHKLESVAGHFIYRVMEVAGVESWDDLPGKTVRVKAKHDKIKAIGHIVKDDWFDPDEDFKSVKEGE